MAGLDLRSSACDNRSTVAVMSRRPTTRRAIQMNSISRRLYPVSAACVLALFVSSASAPPVAGAAPGIAAEALHGITIFNFGQVSDTYYRGGELKDHDAADLAKL